MTNVPELRFKGFTDAWAQRKFEDDVSLVGGATPYKQNADYWNGDIVWVSSQEIKEKYVASGTYMITKKAIDDNATKAVKSGTPLIVTRSGVLANRFPISIPTVDVAINQDIKALVFDTDKINTDYFVAHLQKLEDFILKWVVKGGTTVQSVNVPDLLKMELRYPSIEEQEQIGQFFCTLDNTIAIYKRKLDGLRKLKKAYLQQMFPQAGEMVPKIRFAGHDEPWREVALGDIAERVTRKNSDLKSTLPLTISAQHGLIDQTEFFNKQVASRDVSGYFLVWNGEFAYNKSYSNGYPWGAVKRLDKYEMGVLSTLYIVFKPVAVESEFLVQYYETDNWHTEIIKYAAEGARNHGLLNITPADFFKTILFVPKSQKEQEAIGNFFLSLDNQIDAQSQQLEQVKKLKTAYLEKMFI